MAPRYDLDLFKQLNDEYKTKRIVPAPRKMDPASLEAEARRRAGQLDNRLGGIRGARVLEIGAGRGQLCGVLVEELDCDVTGVDVVAYDSWENAPKGVRFLQADMAGDVSTLGKFDFIYSFSVWEHIEHPYTALENAMAVLEPEGRMFLQAQLYRGPKASHRYREVYFPWPHLLFDDDVFEAYYRSIGREPMRAAWVNKLTYAHYLMYFDLVGWEKRRVKVSDPIFDEEFYLRFEEVLGAYPRWDLARDVILATLARPKNPVSRPPQTSATAAKPPPTFARRVYRGVRRRVRQRLPH